MEFLLGKSTETDGGAARAKAGSLRTLRRRVTFDSHHEWRSPNRLARSASRCWPRSRATAESPSDAKSPSAAKSRDEFQRTSLLERRERMTAAKLRERTFANDALRHDATRARRQLNSIACHASLHFKPRQSRRANYQTASRNRIDRAPQFNDRSNSRPVIATSRSKTQRENLTEIADSGLLEQRI